MKIQLKPAAVLAALFILSNMFPAFTVNADGLSEEASVSQNGTLIPEDASGTTAAVMPEESETPVPDYAPIFCADIESSFQGYVVRGILTEVTSDISHVQPLYSLDDITYYECGKAWDQYWMDTEEPGSPEKLLNYIWLYDNFEPLKSYLAETLDRFYLKLRLTKNNGITYETRAAVIDRGAPQPIPDGITPVAMFAPSMLVRETGLPYYCGKYQLTVSANTAPEDISAFLPDTLPIEIQLPLKNDNHHIAKCIVNCPVNWKPLSFSRLAPGESLTIPDAAEELVVPADTLLNTPMGIFQLDKPLTVGDDIVTDEVRLVLNAAPEDRNPTGVLFEERDGLEIAFLLKPTGATSIQAYTLSEGESDWVKLSELPLSEVINAQPSTASSAYVYVLDNNQEPYRSYLAARDAESIPTPFFVGLKIEGGVFDGRQLVLPWPDTYDQPLALPNVGGAGGNEGNAGSVSKNDSTEEGQRPNLPQNPKEDQDSAARPVSSQNPEQDQDSAAQPVPSLNSEQDQDSAADMTAESDLADRNASSEQSPIVTQTVSDIHPNEKYTGIAITGICLASTYIAISVYRMTGRNKPKP